MPVYNIDWNLNYYCGEIEVGITCASKAPHRTRTPKLRDIYMMKTPIVQSLLLVILITMRASYGVAQESSIHHKSAPSMSSDGASIHKDFERIGIEWKRYSPEGFDLSFELPGEPFERPYPLTPELQSVMKEARLLD